MLRRAGVQLVVAAMAIAWVAVVTTPVDAIASATCDVRGGSTVEVRCADVDGSGTRGQGSASGETRVCTTAFGRVVACTSSLGTWTGDCYARPADPQPPLTDPIWAGRTEGTIVVCTAPSLGTYFARTYSWVPDTTLPDPADLAREAAALLDLAPPPLVMTPPPNLADPNVLINRPAFFTFSDVGPSVFGPVSATASDGGLIVTVTARLDQITIDVGDGTTIACSPSQVRASPGWAAPSSVCSYTWTRTSTDQRDGTFHITGTSYWDITWSGGGQRGTLSRSTTAALQAAVTDYPVSLVTGD